VESFALGNPSMILCLLSDAMYIRLNADIQRLIQPMVFWPSNNLGRAREQRAGWPQTQPAKNKGSRVVESGPKDEPGLAARRQRHWRANGGEAGSRCSWPCPLIGLAPLKLAGLSLPPSPPTAYPVGPGSRGHR